jgi:peptide/nickel transport system permease protein
VADDGWVRRLVGPVRYLAKLLFSVALTFLGLTCVTFFIGRVIPIDPVLAIVGDKASVQTYARVRAEIGLDLPIPVQYWRYLMKVLHGDFGTSVITSQPVLRDLLHVFPATLELSMLALLIGVVLGIPLGVIAATHRGRWQDQVIRFASLLGYSMPVFWLGLVGLLAFYAKLGWVAGPGRLDVGYDGIVPTITSLITVDSLRSRARAGVLERDHPSGIAGLDPWLPFACVRGANDAQLHAQPAEARVCPGDYGQRTVALSRGVGARPGQRLGSTCDRDRLDLRQSA